jgi:hypothetical protein
MHDPMHAALMFAPVATAIGDVRFTNVSFPESAVNLQPTAAKRDSRVRVCHRLAGVRPALAQPGCGIVADFTKVCLECFLLAE